MIHTQPQLDRPGDLLLVKPDKTLYTANLGDPIRKVVTAMHQYGISQMPVVGVDGALVGGASLEIRSFADIVKNSI